MFGKPKVTGNGVCLDQFDTKRAVYLLARLALSQRKAIARSDAAEMLWPDDFFDATRLRLRQELSRLRRRLGPARVIVETDDEWVRLVDQDLDVDVKLFEELFEATFQENDPVLREEYCLKALDMSADPFLAGYEELWIDAERVRLGEMRHRLFLDLAALQAQRGDHEASLASARRAVDLNALNEAGHLLAVQALGALGHVSDALGQFQQLKRSLREGLSQVPSEEALRAVSALSKGAAKIPQPRPVGTGLTLHVPAPSEPIYGREEMVKHVARTLDPTQTTHRIVCLTGPGGIGKTRLAAQIALELQGAYGNRIGWVSFADISDPANIPAALALQLGVILAPNTDPLERVAALMPREPVLLVLDNLEHLVPEGLGSLKTLAESGSNLRLIVTSRVALNLSGERLVRVEPLPIPTENDTLDQPAMRIFLDPLFAEQGFSEPSQNDWALLRQIAKKLECIPLALQLASGRLRSVTPEDLLGQLDQRLDILNKRSDAPERHRTIRASIAGSFQVLDPKLQQIMGRLAVFRGGWNQSAAAKVCELDDALPALEQLLDYSLITVDREDRGLRFRMLETIRDYVHQEISLEDLRLAQARHADWIIDLGQPDSCRSIDAKSFEQLKIIDPEQDNLRAAARYCLENDLEKAALLGATFGKYWTTRSLITEALRFYSDLFEHLEELPVTKDLARASFEHATLCYITNAFHSNDIGPAVSERTRKLCQEAGLDEELAISRLHEARILQIFGDMDGCFAAIEDAEVRLRELGSSYVGVAMHARAQNYYYQGNTQEAAALLEEVANILGTAEAPFYLVQTSMLLAYVYVEAGEIKKAREHSHRALSMAELHGDRRFTPMIQEVCGKVSEAEGDLDKAEQWFRASVSGWVFFGNTYQQADVSLVLARVHLAKNEPENALPLIREAVRLWQGKGVQRILPKALRSAARAYLQMGKATQAARFLGAVKSMKDPSSDSGLASEIGFMEDIQTDLAKLLAPDELANIYALAPDVETALQEAFPSKEACHAAS
ncbi:MAG TPA: BTAD domain-containing putative transcriptional regulator [Fimbriimonadaceae bacterium]|jgi:predicted ATPase/DNA-binding SARP family transcriptional activator